MNSTNAPIGKAEFSVRSLIDQEINGKKIVPGYRFSCSEDELVDTLFSSRARLDEVQKNPPFGLVAEMADRAKDLDAFGPSVTDGICALIESKALGGGLRRTSVDGAILGWVIGVNRAQRVANNLFARDNRREVLGQLQKCQEVRTKKAEKEEYPRKLSPEVARERGLHFLESKRKAAHWIDGGPLESPVVHVYAHVGHEWKEFILQLSEVRKLMDKNLLRGLREGRIIAVNDTNSGHALIQPMQWRDQGPLPPYGKNTAFLFSRDLPEKWWSINMSKEEGERRAHGFILKAEDWCNENGKQLTQNVAVQIIVRNHWLRSEGAVRVWREVGMEIGWTKHNPKRENKLSPSEIKELEIMARSI